MELVRICPPAFDIDLALAYAGPDNFTGCPVYARTACWLHRDAADRLARAIVLAAGQNLRLRIFDGFRPVEAQRALWAHTPDPVFIADPDVGSTHSRGVAVDLTLAEASSGVPLAMGTGFDAFTPASHHGDTGIEPVAQRNRYLLLGLMMTAGWDFFDKEWWHYQLFQPERYPLLGDDVLPEPMMSAPGRTERTPDR